MEESVFDPSYGDPDYVGSGDTESVFDPSYGDPDYIGGGGNESVFDPENVDWSGYADLSPTELAAFQATNDPDFAKMKALAEGTLGNQAAAFLKKYLFDPKTGKVNLAGLGTAGMALYNLAQSKDVGGYNKPVPKMDMVREQIQYDDPNRRPGEAGRQYFTDPRFAAQGDAGALAAAKTGSTEQAAGLKAAYQARPAQAVNPYAGKIPTAWNKPVDTTTDTTEVAGLPQIPTQLNDQGGIPMARGGIADAGRYLHGATDGMADKIPSSIDGKQRAALSHGEFVIPADVVSHLGNGNSEAGADKLYAMMDRIREARTGTKKQGKEIDADKFLAAASGGLAAAYAVGGAVKGYDAGGTVATTATAAPTGAGGVPLDTSKTSTLSPWVGDYVTDALGKGAALANAPYEAYKGPLTAGESTLQQQAFAGASDIASAGYKPAQYMGGFGVQQAQQYMNPYLQASLDPQLKELKRQSDIARLQDAGRMTQAGAFGGSRQAIMESEGRRNLLDKQADVLGTGYKQAYDTGMGQFNKEREAEEASRQFGANYGMKSVGQLADLGATQRGITSEGIAADKAQFEEQRDYAYNMPKYQLGLLSGLPIGASTSTTDQDALSKLTSDISGLGSLYKNLEKLIPTTTTPG
jgi:hypothetical protein